MPSSSQQGSCTASDGLSVFQRTGNWFIPRKNRAYPALIKAAIRIPGVQAFRRWFLFQYAESLTLMIRQPKTLGRIGRARSSIFMRYQRKDPGAVQSVPRARAVMTSWSTTCGTGTAQTVGSEVACPSPTDATRPTSWANVQARPS